MANLLAASLIGVLIRLNDLFPIPHFNYVHWIHAHSHVAFLGWVFMGLIGLINVYLEKEENFPDRKFRNLAWFILLANIGMLVSFPVQGYGPVSIFFSAMHMAFGIYIFLSYRPFFRKYTGLGFRLVRWGFVFMIISGLGPLALGPISAMGHKESVWYDMAIYFYLHFQYNGFFTLVILGLIIHHLNRNNSLYLEKISAAIVSGLVAAVILTYFLSILGTDPPIVFYLLGGLGAVIQIVVVIMILITILRYYASFFHRENVYINILLVISLTCLETKLYLQFLSGIPALADFVFSDRNIIIVYLHMVLLGFITSFIISWWYRLNPVKMSIYFSWSILNYILGFVGSETILLLIILKVLNNLSFAWQLLLLFSVFMVAGFTGIFAGFSNKASHKF